MAYEESKIIRVSFANGEIEEGTLSLLDEAPDNEDMVQIKVQFKGKEITATDENYFNALRKIRRVLETDDVNLLCYGSSLNVYPSPMDLDMGQGMTAYRLKMGQSGREKDKVHIFDYGDDIIPATIAQQEQHYNDWLESLSNLPATRNESS